MPAYKHADRPMAVSQDSGRSIPSAVRSFQLIVALGVIWGLAYLLFFW
jgi:hypothetical protein